ncbi:hypothetical protein [Aequorivita echinoideorum]|uniref:Lipoprotein n=1 Tax=Aequorivita echinoideorum TaxID=1549647 RepID=A0ABS5S1V4_9FLAO|nr:hypothetical protein [Aequorivita echinoideorum]MBT0607193.1 hypothetical protein [Aequorivita echinoideorum]
MKFLSVVALLPILFVGFANCGGSKANSEAINFQKNPPFKIAEVYYQNWVAGVEEGGSGKNVHITFSEMETGVKIQSIYFNNKILELKNNSAKPMEYIGFHRNEMRSDVIMDSDPMKEAQNTPSEKNIFSLQKNEAVLSYTFKGKTEYFKISNLPEKEMMAYPQSNPNSHE